MPRMDENEFETQAALEDNEDEWTSASDDGSGGDDDGPTDTDPLIAEGDIVCHMNHPNVFGMMIEDDQLVLEQDTEGLVTWFAVPTFCGDPNLLFQQCSIDQLICADRGHEPNDIVSAACSGGKQKGMVLSTSITVSGYPLHDVLHYHSRSRFSEGQEDLTNKLQPNSTNLQRMLSFHSDPKWIGALSAHRRSLGLQQRSGTKRSLYIPSHPFAFGTLVRSKEPVSMSWAEYPDQDLIRPDARPFLQVHADGASDVSQHYLGHITGVWYSALVELFLPDTAAGRKQAKRSGPSYDPKYLVIIPAQTMRRGTMFDESQQQQQQPADGSSSSSSSSDEESESSSSSGSAAAAPNASEPPVMFRHLLNMIAMDIQGYHDGSNSVAPPNMDTVAPLMYAENIDMHVLEHDVIWIRGSYEEYRRELSTAFLASNPSSRNLPQELVVKLMTGNGIVVFSFPEQVSLDPLPYGSLRLADLEPIVTSGSEVACEVFGKCGFLVDIDEDLPVQHASTGKASTVAGGAVLPSADSMIQWYEACGVLLTAEERADQEVDKKAVWQRRVAKLYQKMGKLVCVVSTHTTADVAWRERCHVTAPEKVDGSAVEPEDRNTLDDHDLYPSDCVIPSPSYLTLPPHGDIPPVGILDERCPLFDVLPLYEFQTEMQVGEPVRIAYRTDDVFYVQNEEVDDPPVIGLVETVDIEHRLCSVRWFAQPSGEALRATREALYRDRMHDIGILHSVLSDTTLLIMWKDGTLERVHRSLLMPCRPEAQNEDEDTDDGDEESVDDLVEQAIAPLSTTSPELADEQDPPTVPPPSVPSRGSNGISAAGVFKQAVRGLSLLASALVRQPAEMGEELLATAAAKNQHSDPVATTPPATEGDGTSQSSLLRASSFTESSTLAAHKWLHENDGFQPVNALSFARRVQREWKDLRQQLTSGPLHDARFGQMHVKVCSESMRLLKFVLIGPLHTPYYQSFLAFDLAFTEEFPIRPPKVSFHAHGIRLNPNLYADGHICLSLLGTWEGTGASESWNPVHSSVMQILLSIQSLVLVKEPYYNEAGYEDRVGTTEGRSASTLYNENIALARIAHLCKMAEHPPPDWVFEFRDHFRVAVPLIIQRLRRVLDDNANHVSYGAGAITADGLVLPLSEGFVISMTRSLAALAASHQKMVAKWDAEEAEFSLEHMDL